MLLGMSSVFAVRAWMSLISLPSGRTSYNSVIPSGKTLISAQGLAIVKGLDAALMLDGLQVLHMNMLALCWIFLFLLQACSASNGSVRVVTIVPGMRGHGLGLRFPDLTGFATFAGQVHWVMRGTLSLSVRDFCASGSNGLTCFRGHK